MTPTAALNDAAHWLARSQKDVNVDARARAYNPRYDAHQYLCPRCWVLTAARSPMRSVPGTSEYDVLVCNTCDGDVVVPFD